MLVARLWSEPYPALYQPSFAGAAQGGEQVEFTVPRVTMHARGGEDLRLHHMDLMAESRVAEIAVFSTAFPADNLEDALEDSSNAQWLQSRLEELTGESPEAATVEWIRYTAERNASVEYASVEYERVIESAYRVEFDE
ncbi:hypothetical protein ER308_12500 [Egibacter rhizosphaerae]|uniref:Uncharacterized protein n=1 Tax=Egibacter rhizosphaerae TaxID=1670831 RepID=A0A411YGU8_9ACTN|nr:hypothetical protein [Egibacter rhizosphaerae]QBI20302.1 hypothetical protein ER308_12500 [Egibacter rhizosphaerae]